MCQGRGVYPCRENIRMTTQNTTTAIIIWNAEQEQAVRKLIATGATVPNALRLAAPKGFLKPLQLARRNELMGNSSLILGQVADKGFKLSKLSDEKVLASGEIVVNAQFRKPAAPRAMTDSEIEATFGKGLTVEAIRAAISLVGGEKPAQQPKQVRA